MEGRIRGREVCQGAIHRTQCVGEDEVDVASSVHEDLAHLVPADLGFEYKG